MPTRRIIDIIRYQLSPFYIPRKYLSRDLKLVIEKHTFTGSILDIGCGSKPYRPFFRDAISYTGIDFETYSLHRGHRQEPPDYYFPPKYLEDFVLPFKDGQFDNSVSFQVLEHHRSPAMMISEMHRVTKKGGYMLITAPFLGGVHEAPNDFQRYTRYGLQNLFAEHNIELVELVAQGSIASTIAMLLNEYVDNLVRRGGTTMVIGLIIYAPILIYSRVSPFLDFFTSSKDICFNYLVLARKK